MKSHIVDIGCNSDGADEPFTERQRDAEVVAVNKLLTPVAQRNAANGRAIIGPGKRRTDGAALDKGLAVEPFPDGVSDFASEIERGAMSDVIFVFRRGVERNLRRVGQRRAKRAAAKGLDFKGSRRRRASRPADRPPPAKRCWRPGRSG